MTPEQKKERKRLYNRVWSKANPDKMRKYAERVKQRQQQDRRLLGKTWRSLPKAEARQIFEETAPMAKNIVTRYQFQRLQPDKIARDFDKIILIK